MKLFDLSTPFPLGFVIGILGSILGAGIDYIYSRGNRRTTPISGFLLLSAGVLNTFVGGAAILISILVTGSIRTALVLGLGVLSGFVLGFLAIALLAIFSSKYESTADYQDERSTK
jgi:hypothetical protein